MSETWVGKDRIVGHIPGGCHPVPLGQPVILLDTRGFVPNWSASPPTINAPLAATTEYVGDLPNLGTGGDKFDLHVLVEADYTFPKYVYAAKTREWPNIYGTTGDSFPAGWDDLGGDMCQAPVTWMVATGAIDGDVYETFFGSLASYRLSGVEYLFRWERDDAPGVFNSSVLMLYLVSFLYYGRSASGDPVPDGPEFEGFHGLYSRLLGNECNPTEPDARLGECRSFANRLITATVDARCDEIYLWLDDELIFSSTFTGAYEELHGRFYAPEAGCLEQSGRDVAPFDNLRYQFQFLGYHHTAMHVDESPAAFFPADTPWNGIVGTAMFRGSPTRNDLVMWRDYFFDGNVAPAAVELKRMVRPIPSVLAYDQPYSDSVTVPSGVTRVRFKCSGAIGSGVVGGSGLSWMFTFDATVTPGDVIDVDLGGSGLSNGFGGWPDGGDGGVNTSNSLRGGGGGGSTRIFLNSTLIAVIGGAAGGGYISASTNGDGRGGGSALPPAVDGANGLTGAAGGEGGTSSAAGAAGTGGSGATAGSGANGGRGADITLAFTPNRSGGGGGGGGAYGGGGGGWAGGTSQGAGGGAGSHWFDSVCTNIKQMSSAPGSAAFVHVFRLP